MSQEHWCEGNVYLRGSTFWIRYPDGTGKQRRESAGKDLHNAQKQLSDRLYEAKHDSLPAKSKERNRTVNDLLDALVKDCHARKKRSAHETGNFGLP